MGQAKSKERYQKAVKKLSSLELDNIEAVFQELSTKTEDGTRRVELSLLTRQDFAERFQMTGFVAERLFHAFDKTESGTIDLEEFIGGIALCLHGSVRDKCRLLFRIFDLDEDDGVSKDELTAVLLSSVESAEKILSNISEDKEHAESNETDKLIEHVTIVVQQAFATCDTSKTGKLSAKEFEQWLFKHPKIMDNVFGWQCPRPEEGQWMNEGADQQAAQIGFHSSSPPRNPSPFTLEPTKESRKLSDLFNVPVSGTSEEQSFFDSLNQPQGEQGLIENKGIELQTGDNNQGLVDSLVDSEEPGLDVLHDSHEILQEAGFYQDQPLIPDQCASPDIPSEPPHKSLEDIVEAQKSQPELLVGELPSAQSYQFVQQPFPTPIITQHHLQDISIPQETFQPLTVPVMPTHQQTVSSPHMVQAHHVERRTSESDQVNKEQHVTLPAVQVVELNTKQSEQEKLSSTWIPTLQTSQFLSAIGSGLMNKEHIDQQYLTSPGIVIDEPQYDPVKDLLYKFSEDQDTDKRQTLGVDNVPLNESGLRDLLVRQYTKSNKAITALSWV